MAMAMAMAMSVALEPLPYRYAPIFNSGASAKNAVAFKQVPIKTCHSLVATNGRWNRILRRAAPQAINNPLDDKVEESIKAAQETCAEDATSGECVAAWDEVEELSAARNDKKSQKKVFDPLEEYCKENPESDECRVYED